MSVPDNLRPTHSEKILGAMKADRKVNRITFKTPKASPGETLYVDVPKLNKNQVIVPGSLALLFDIDLKGGHANNFLVQNVTRALVERMVVKFGAVILEDTKGYDIYKIYEDLFLSKEIREEMILEGIQGEDLCKIRSDAGDKKTSGVDAEEKLEKVFGKKYRIRLDHQILTDHGVFYPQALSDYLSFELTLAEALQVVKGSESKQLKYELENIELEYEFIHSKTLSDEAESEYYSGKEFSYDNVQRAKVVTFSKSTDKAINITINTQRRSMKAVLLLFKEPYAAGTRDSEKFIFPDLTKVNVTLKSIPQVLYNKGIEGKDMWKEAKRFFVKKKTKTENMDLTKFYTGDAFCVLIDLRSMADQAMHGSGKRIVNSADGVFLEIERSVEGSGNVNCHVFTISDAQFNIQDRQLESVQY